MGGNKKVGVVLTRELEVLAIVMGGQHSFPVINPFNPALINQISTNKTPFSTNISPKNTGLLVKIVAG